MEERQGVITFRGTPLTLLGHPVQKGEKAPDFLLLANDLSPRTLGSYYWEHILLNTFRAVAA
jgi:thiol peroxidase